MKRRIKRIMVTILMMAFLITNHTGSIAKASEKTTDVQVSIVSSAVDIVIPLNVLISIDPNKEKAEGFTYSDCTITNKSKSPIKLYVESVTSNNAPFMNIVNPTTLPQDFDWNHLSIEDTMKYFAIGIKPQASNGWQTNSAITNFLWCSYTL